MLALEPRGRAILRTQLDALEIVQRFSKDKLVVFHLERDALWDRFPNEAEELSVAMVTLETAGGRRVKAEVVFHGGRISSLELRAAVVGEATVREIELLADPMSPDTSKRGPGVEGPALEALRAELELPITDVAAPADARRRAAFARRLGVSLPDDFLRLLEETDGFRVGGWLFAGTAARNVVRDEASLVLVAESEDSQLALCLYADDTEPSRFHRYDMVQDELHPLSSSFVESFSALVKDENR
jgi:hypothetical protein